MPWRTSHHFAMIKWFPWGGTARYSGDFTKETEGKWRFNPQKDAGIHMDSNYVYYVEIDGLS
jgi:hypothetical protein